MKLYYLIGRLLSPFGIAGLHLYSYLTRTARTRVVVQNERGEVLLVQTWLGGGKWGLPGGGTERGEAPEKAALRELKEETGIVAHQSALRLFDTVMSAGHKEIVFLLTVSSDTLPKRLPNQFEIKEAGWFSFDDLPRLESLAATIIATVAKKA